MLRWSDVKKHTNAWVVNILTCLSASSLLSLAYKRLVFPLFAVDIVPLSCKVIAFPSQVTENQNGGVGWNLRFPSLL